MFIGVYQILLNFVFGTAVFFFLLRFWLQLMRAPFNNAFVQSLYKFLAPVLMPIERIIPKFRNANLACLLIAYLIALIWSIASELQFQPELLIAALVRLLDTSYWLIVIFMILYALMSLVVFRGKDLPELVLKLITPIIAPVRRAIPPLGPFDLAFAVVMLCITLAYFLMQFGLVKLMSVL
jgi:YggT family protein